MARISGPLLSAVALLLCTFTTTIQAGKCPTGCGGVTPKVFKYQEGTTYKYNLDGNVVIQLSTAENQQSTTKVTGTVLLTQQSDCTQILRLQNVQVIGPDAKKYPSLANIEKAVRLNFHDGHLEDVICSEPDDTQHSLNVKRAVASMFQAALEHNGHEHDVFGKCDGDISSRKEGANVIIQKTRDLTKCSHREWIKQDFLPGTFNLKAIAGSGPLFANYESEQRLKNGILDHALVTENYLYKPFSDGKSHGVTATITTKLSFVSQKKEAVTAKVSEPKSIFFEAPHLETIKTANVDNILNALKETKKTMDVSVSEDSAATFVQLIGVIRSSKKDDILAAYGQVKTGAGGFKDKEGARKVFFDALFRAGNGDAIEVIVELLKNKELSPIEQKLGYLSFTFLQHGTKGSLTSAATLLDQPDLPREAYLGIGNLAGKYCSEHSCENVEELNKLLQKLAGKLNSQPANRKAENEAIAVMKALSNVRHISDSLADKLIQIMNDKKSPIRMRVAALETSASDACKPKLLNAALNLLKNRQEDSEIRIKAYKVLVECPDAKIAQAIKELVDTEPVYQVGGYISSHLRNLRASANPDRERAKQYLGTIKPSRQYPIDPRKFSFNNEFSYNVDSIGAGNTLESDVIFSQNSFLPRSVNLNLTTDFMGHNLDILEVGIRQENLEKVLEHYLGPLGVLNKQSTNELLQNGKDSIQNIVEHFRKRLEKSRGKRDVTRAAIDSFAKTVKIPGSELNKDLDLDLNLKLFGSEFLFLSLNEDIHKLTPDAIIDKFFDCLDQGLDKAKNFEYHLKNHMLFTELHVSYPTSTGFPLRYSIHGAAAVHFIASGSVDVRQILKDPKNAEIHLKVIPSANIDVSGGLSIDAHFVRSGIMIKNKLLTSTGSDLTIKLLNNEGIDVKLGLPVEKQKLISYSHKIVMASREFGKPLVATPLKFKDKPREFSVCFDQLSPIIGLTFCGELNSPSTLASNHVGFPLNGDLNLELSIERDDVNEYHFKALAREPTPSSKQVELTFETPNSKTNRHFTLLLEAGLEPTKHLRATLKSPFKEAVAEAVITDTAQEKSAMVRFHHDKNEYLAKIGVSVKGSPEKQIYQPLIEYSTPSDLVKTKGNRKPDYTVEGQVILEKEGSNRKFVFDNVKLVAPNQPNILINGYLAMEGTIYSGDLKVSRESVSISTKGKIQIAPNALALNAEMQNSVNPNANFNVKLDFKKPEQGLDGNFVLIHGPDLSSKKHCLTLGINYKYNPDKGECVVKNKVTYPLLGVEGKLDAVVGKKVVNYDLTVAYDKFKLESELDVKVAIKEVGDYDIKFEVEAMNNKMELKLKRDINGDKSNIKNSLELSGRKYSVEGTVTHHCKPNDINIGTDLVIKIHEKPDSLKVDTGLICNSQQLDSHAKISVGSNAVVDIVIKGTKGADANGNLKVIVQNVINANGNFKFNDGKGTGELLMEIPKLNRKIKADGSVTCKDSVHNGVLNVFFDFEKDNTKKLHIETNNQLTENSVDTKNKLELMDYKFEANAQAKRTGTFNDGTLNGQFDITLPDKHVFSGKLDKEVHSKEGVANGNIHVNLQHKKADGTTCKFDLKGVAKDTDFKKGIIDLTYNIVAENDKGKNVHADIVLKHKHDSVNHESAYSTKLHGSLLPTPLEISGDCRYTRTDGTHKASIFYGSNAGIKTTTTYNVAGGATPLSGGFDVELIIPNDKYKNVKLHVDGQAKKPEQDNGLYEANGNIVATLNNEKTVKLHGDVKSSNNKGEVKFDATLPDSEPLGFGVKYDCQKTETGGKLHGEVNMKYAKDKEVKGGLTLNKISDDEADLEVNLVTPNEKAKNINLQLKTKKDRHNKHFINEVILTADQQRYSVNNELIISEISPSLNILIKYPDGKESKIYAKFDRLSPKEYKGEVKILAIKDFNFEADGEAKLDSIDDFNIILNLNSPKLKLDKVKFEASNKGSKTGKKIQFSAKSGDVNLISGSTSYKANEEGGKFIVEGSGSVKVKEDTRTATFKYIKQHLQQEKDSEQGVEVLLHANIGNQGIVGELKLTNKQFRLLNSYCEEKKQCAHIEVYSKTNAVDSTVFNHELEINVDLRKLGLSHEFGLKSVTNREMLVLDHTVDIHFESSANSKYQYSIYIHPKEAGIQFTTPKRVISLEAKCDSTNKDNSGSYKADVTFYLNKNAEPNKKTYLSYNTNYNFGEKTGSSNCEWKFSTPGLGKELSMVYSAKYDIPNLKSDFTVDLDIFAKKNQKISVTAGTQGTKVENGYEFTSTAAALSKGLNIDIKATEIAHLSTKKFAYDFKVNSQVDKSKYDHAFVAKACPKHIELQIRVFSRDLINVHSTLELSKESQVADTKISVIGIEDLVSHSEVKNFNTFIFTLAKKATPQNKLKFSSGLIMGQIADARFVVEKDGTKTDVAHASLKLDDGNFMKPDFGVDTNYIEKNLLPMVQKESSKSLENLKLAIDDYQKILNNEIAQVTELAKKSAPNVKPATEYYKQELLKLKEELISDKTIQEVSEFLKKIFGTVVGTFSEVFTKLNEFTDKLVAIFSENFSKITDVIAKDLLPTIKEIGSKILDVYLSLMKSFYDLAMLYIVKLTEILKAHQAELKQAATVLSEAFQDAGRLFVKFFNQIKEDVEVFVKKLYDQIKALPIYEELQLRYKEMIGNLPVPEQILNVLNEVCATFKVAMPTEETKQFINVVQEYIAKKIRKEAIDDTEALKQIYNAFVKAVNSLIKFIQNQQPGQVDYKSVLNNIVPVHLERFYNLPKISVPKFSPLNILLNNDLPSLKQFFKGQSLYPKIFFPMTHYGIVAQGQHIFTFDNRHLTFPGKCNYVFAKDAVNSNFTFIGQYKDGQLDAITFADKHNIVTLKKNQQVLLNGKESELPIRLEGLEVFRLYENVQIVSKAGVHIISDPHLEILSVTVNGFYHSQLRGLLGNANYEPYDDFTMPNGKITTNEAEFGNAYKTSSGCGAVKAVDHSVHKSNPKCDELFGLESRLRFCYPLVDPEGYKQACEHGLSAGVANTEKYIAMAYVLECKSRGVFIPLPPQFLQCTNSDKPVDFGTQFSVKTPTKSADIVVVVEQTKNNEPIFKELVQPVITQITNDLTAKGINDIEFSLLGYGGEYQKYPSHYTSGGKLTFQGKAANLKFSDPVPEKPFDSGCSETNARIEKVKKFIDEAMYQLALTPDLDATREALRYPFRAQAAKAVIFVTAEGKVKFSPLLLFGKYLSQYDRKDGIHVSLITPLESLKLNSKDPKQVKNIVGFDEDGVFTFADAKKKGDGSSELRKEIEFGNDHYVDYVLNRHGGKVFIANNFQQAKGGQKKQFVQVVSHVIAEDIVNKEYGFDCQCKLNNIITAKNVCKVVSVKNATKA